MNWANVLTWTRICLIVPITIAALLDARIAVVVLYVLAGLTDFLDGIVARATGVASKKGAAFDSQADLAMLIGIFAWLYILFPTLYSKYLVPIIVILLLEIITVAIAYTKMGSASGLHLWSGKISATLGYVLLPFLIFFGENAAFVWFCIVVAAFSALDAIVYLLKGGKNLDARFFWDQ